MAICYYDYSDSHNKERAKIIILVIEALYMACENSEITNDWIFFFNGSTRDYFVCYRPTQPGWWLPSLPCRYSQYITKLNKCFQYVISVHFFCLPQLMNVTDQQTDPRQRRGKKSHCDDLNMLSAYYGRTEKGINQSNDCSFCFCKRTHETN